MPTFDSIDILNRRTAIKQIIIHLKRQGTPVNRFTIKPYLDQRGFVVNHSTIYRDLTIINRENTWVRDLAESNYSAYQEQISNTLDWIEQQAIILYNKDWKSIRTTQKQVPANDGTKTLTEQTVTSESANQKATFLSIIKQVQELKIKHTNGENINISAALLGKRFSKIKESEPTTKIDVLKLASSR